MAHDTMLPRQRGSLIALLLVAFACGDGGATGTAPAADGARQDMSAPAVTDALPSPAETPMESASAAMNGAGESVGDAITLDGVTPPPSADDSDADSAAAGGSSAGTPSEAPSDGASPTPGAEDPSGVSLAHGADPTRQSASGPGPLNVTISTAGLRDGPDYGSQTLYVPEGVEAPFAGVVIVPGFNTPESSIAAWGPFLASHGIVALTIGTNSPTDSAEARASAVLDALETLRAENARSGSPLEGKLAADHLGIMGWSLGGGGVLIAASSTPSLKAAITMAAFSPGGRFSEDQVPTLFLAGSADPNAGGQSQGLFASLPETTPKMLFEVRDGPHEIGNDPQNAAGEIGRYGLSWLEVFLVGDERYRQFLEEPPAQASDFRENLTSAP